MLSSKSSMYFNLITNLNSEKPHFKCPVAIHGYHIGQHRSVPVESNWKLGGEWGEPGVSRKWPENGEESCKSGNQEYDKMCFESFLGHLWFDDWSSAAQVCLAQFSSVTQSCLTLCNPMNHSTPGLPVLHQLLESTQTHVQRVSDAIQSSHPLSSPSPPAPNPSQH